MSKIFLSYRREDSSGHMIALYKLLEAHFGRDSVFKDIDSIPLGLDFVKEIEKAVGACDVMLVAIGCQWLSVTNEAGQRQLDIPNDWVRLEIETALRRNIRIIPVLFGGGAMPKEDALPQSLKTLAQRQAIEIRDTSFDADADRLIRALKSATTTTTATTAIDGEIRAELIPSDNCNRILRVFLEGQVYTIRFTLAILSPINYFQLWLDEKQIWSSWRGKRSVKFYIPVGQKAWPGTIDFDNRCVLFYDAITRFRLTIGDKVVYSDGY